MTGYDDQIYDAGVIKTVSQKTKNRKKAEKVARREIRKGISLPVSEKRVHVSKSEGGEGNTSLYSGEIDSEDLEGFTDSESPVTGEQTSEGELYSTMSESDGDELGKGYHDGIDTDEEDSELFRMRGETSTSDYDESAGGTSGSRPGSGKVCGFLYPLLVDCILVFLSCTRYLFCLLYSSLSILYL